MLPFWVFPVLGKSWIWCPPRWSLGRVAWGCKALPWCSRRPTGLWGNCRRWIWGAPPGLCTWAKKTNKRSSFPFHSDWVDLLPIQSHHRNSPSSGDIVGVRGSGSDFSGESKVGDLHQLRAHAQQILWFHVPMEKAWTQTNSMSTLTQKKPSKMLIMQRLVRLPATIKRHTMFMNERQALQYLEHYISHSRLRKQPSPAERNRH